MIMYNAERHRNALEAGTLAEDFEDEIEKSWKEYVEQVGADIAEGEGRGFWKEALNDILAKGERVF
jgi:capsid protein